MANSFPYTGSFSWPGNMLGYIHYSARLLRRSINFSAKYRSKLSTASYNRKQHRGQDSLARPRNIWFYKFNGKYNWERIKTYLFIILSYLLYVYLQYTIQSQVRNINNNKFSLSKIQLEVDCLFSRVIKNHHIWINTCKTINFCMTFISNLYLRRDSPKVNKLLSTYKN